MARELKQKHTLMVIDGTDSEPTSLKYEYRVVVGDLFENYRSIPKPLADFTQTVNNLWSVEIGSLKSNEGI